MRWNISFWKKIWNTTNQQSYWQNSWTVISGLFSISSITFYCIEFEQTKLSYLYKSISIQAFFISSETIFPKCFEFSKLWRNLPFRGFRMCLWLRVLCICLRSCWFWGLLFQGIPESNNDKQAIKQFKESQQNLKYDISYWIITSDCSNGKRTSKCDDEEYCGNSNQFRKQCQLKIKNTNQRNKFFQFRQTKVFIKQPINK